jgi:hypothetical protein
MKKLALIVLLMSAELFAQSTVPAGTILPVQLDSSVRSNKLRVGQTVSARLMQDIELPNTTIHAGAKALGYITAVQTAGRGKVSLRFDELVTKHRRIRIITDLRALAGMMDISDAQIPVSGPDRGTSEYSWTTEQIGGEYRSAGFVGRGSSVIGLSLADGALVHPASKSGTECRGEVAGNQQPQALWVFSSDACGVYGLPNVILVHAGRRNPIGEITLQSLHGDVNVRAGSGLLLRVNGGA